MATGPDDFFPLAHSTELYPEWPFRKLRHTSNDLAQRVAVARAMVKRPDLVLADEPTANLDAENSYNILRMMENLNRELNTTFLFAKNDQKVTGYLKRKIHLFDGQVKKDEIVAKENN